MLIVFHFKKTPFIRIRYLILLFFACLGIGTALASPGIKLIENKGQWPAEVVCKAHIPGGNYYLEKNCILYYFMDEAAIHAGIHDHKAIDSFRTHLLKISFVDANPNPAAIKSDASAEYYNYFIGNDKKKWASGANAFGKITLKDLWKGIDLEILSQDQAIKYNFIVHAGADPAKIKLKYLGADDVFLKDEALYVKTSLLTMMEDKPIAWQETVKSKKGIECNYKLNGNELGFEVSNYSSRQDLIIDPTVIFATYSGSEADNFGYTATYDHHGYAYSGGTVYGVGFPTNKAVGPSFQMGWHGGRKGSEDNGTDAGILKYSPDGKKLLWATYLGGRDNEQPHSMVVNHNGELVILGTTFSFDFPMSQGYNTKYNGGGDIYVVKLSSDGLRLTASTFIGGSDRDGFNGQYDFEQGNKLRGALAYNYGDEYRGEVIIDTNNNVLLVSSTRSTNFPVSTTIQTNLKGSQDAVIVKLTPGLNNLLWSTYFGGNREDAGYGITIDRKDNIIVCGGTQSGDFPYSSSTRFFGDIDGYLAKLDKDGKAISAFTYLGTKQYDQAYFVQVDDNNLIYVTGQTKGSFPVVGQVYSNSGGKQFIAAYENDLSKISFSTTFGSGRDIPDLSPSAFLVDLCGRICFSGWGGAVNELYNGEASSTNSLPLSPDAQQRTTDGSDFYLIVFGRNLKTFVYGSYLGGSKSEEHVDGGTSRFDRDGKIYQGVCGGCGGFSDFPTTPDAWSRINNGRRPNSTKVEGCNNALFKMDLNSSLFPPFSNSDTVITVIATETLDYAFNFFDKDKGDSITLSFTGDIFDSKKIKGKTAVMSVINGIDKAIAHLQWQTSCDQIDTYTVVITARDNGCPTPRMFKKTITVIVSKPPPAKPPGIFCLHRKTPSSLLLSWDITTNGATYRLIKESPGGKIEILHTITSKTDLSFLDNNAPNHLTTDYCYYIYGINICGEIGDSTRKICSIPSKDSIPSPVYLKTVTVVRNRVISVSWSQNSRGDYYSYIIYKKLNEPGEVFKLFRVIFNSKDTSLIDSSVDVNSHSYVYKVITNTQCGISSKDGNIGTSILLKGSAIQFENDLKWNQYNDWFGDVHHYVIERHDTSSGYFNAGQTIGKETIYQDSTLNLDWGLYRYRVRAYEGAKSSNATSLSNEIDLIQKPYIIVPNAFSPNADGINDGWRVFPVFVKDLNLSIYNRWGEKVFTSDNKKKYWDGRFRDNDPFNNVYIWQVRYTGWDGSTHYQHGNLTTVK